VGGNSPCSGWPFEKIYLSDFVGRQKGALGIYKVGGLLGWLCLFGGEHCKYTVKKASNFPDPSQDVTNQTLPKLFPARESLASDIPAGDGKITHLFYSVQAACTVWKIKV
jgi:hypothetical protein